MRRMHKVDAEILCSVEVGDEPGIHVAVNLDGVAPDLQIEQARH